LQYFSRNSSDQTILTQSNYSSFQNQFSVEVINDYKEKKDEGIQKISVQQGSMNIGDLEAVARFSSVLQVLRLFVAAIVWDLRAHSQHPFLEVAHIPFQLIKLLFQQCSPAPNSKLIKPSSSLKPSNLTVTTGS